MTWHVWHAWHVTCTDKTPAQDPAAPPWPGPAARWASTGRGACPDSPGNVSRDLCWVSGVTCPGSHLSLGPCQPRWWQTRSSLPWPRVPALPWSPRARQSSPWAPRSRGSPGTPSSTLPSHSTSSSHYTMIIWHDIWGLAVDWNIAKRQTLLDNLCHYQKLCKETNHCLAWHHVFTNILYNNQ